MPRINAALKNRQADYQSSMVEVEGMVNKTPVTILIDPGASLSYISPQIVEKCNVTVENFDNSSLVQLAIGAKRKVNYYVKECALDMNDFVSMCVQFFHE